MLGQDLETYKLYDHHNRCWVMIDSGNWITKTDKERDASVFTDYCEDNVCYIKTHDGYFGSRWVTCGCVHGHRAEWCGRAFAIMQVNALVNVRDCHLASPAMTAHNEPPQTP